MSDVPRKLPPKKEVALALLEGPSIYVHLDPRKPHVLVPKWFLGQPQLVLQVGLNMAIPIPDLKVDEDGLTCTLSFNRAPFWCCLPWSAVYAIVGEDGRGMVWPADVPPEIAQQSAKSGATAKAAKRPKPKLASVPSDEENPADRDQEEQAALVEEAKSPTKPEPLRMVVSRSDEQEQENGEGSGMGGEGENRAAKGTPKKQRRELPPYLRVIK